MFEVLIALVLFLTIYTFSDSLFIAGIGTAILLSVFNVTIDVDQAKVEFDQVAGIEVVEKGAGIEEALRQPPNRTQSRSVVAEQGQYTSRAPTPTNIEARYIDNGKRDKWISVDLWRTDRGGIAACYTDNEPGTNCFKPILRKHTDGALYACFEAGTCHIVKE